MTEQAIDPQPGAHAATPVAPATQARIQLNLDTLEKDARPEPFSFVHHGRQIVLVDPEDLDFFAVEELQDEREFLKLAMKSEDLEFFNSKPIPLWKMDKLGQAYKEHYKVGDDKEKDA